MWLVQLRSWFARFVLVNLNRHIWLVATITDSTALLCNHLISYGLKYPLCASDPDLTSELHSDAYIQLPIYHLHSNVSKKFQNKHSWNPRKTHSSCNVLISANGTTNHIHARNLGFILDNFSSAYPLPTHQPLLIYSSKTFILSVHFSPFLLPPYSLAL